MNRTVPRPNLAGLSRQERVDALRAYKNEVAVASRPAAPPAWLSSTSRRRAVAATAALPLVIGAVAAVLRPAAIAPYLLIAAFVVFMADFFVLRRATALLTDVPEGALDEREIAERGQVFRQAYLTLSGLLALVLLIGVADDLSDGRLLADGGWPTLLTGFFVTSLLVPSAVAAWRWRDAGPDDE